MKNVAFVSFNHTKGAMASVSFRHTEGGVSTVPVSMGVARPFLGGFSKHLLP